MIQEESNQAKIVIKGGEANSHMIKVDVLTDIITRIQTISYLLGSLDFHRPIGYRFKITKELKDKYSIVVGTPVDGCFALPWSMAPNGEFPLSPRDSIPERFVDILQLITMNDWDGISEKIQSREVLARIFNEIIKIIPEQGKPYQLEFYSKKSSIPVKVDHSHSKLIREQIIEPETLNSSMTVTGDLVKIDFSRKIITIRYPPTSKLIECSYLEEIENKIVTSHAEPIQVTGTFILDNDGNPESLTDVTKVDVVDLSPIFISTVSLDSGENLTFKDSLILSPRLEEEGQQYLLCEFEPLGMFAYGQNRELLIDEIESQIRMAWLEYGCADDKELFVDAIKVKQYMKTSCTVE